MPNLYATLTEIKAGLPGGIRATTTDYDAVLQRAAGEVSRFVDRHCRRVFYPYLATRRFRGHGGCELRIGDLLSLTSVAISFDNGLTYTTLASTDYFLTCDGDPDTLGSYTHLELDRNGDYSYWPTGQRSVKVTGVWAYADDRAAAWEDSTDEVQNAALTDSGLSVTVADDDGAGLWGLTPRFQAGQLVRIESEFLEVTAAATNALTVVRGRNGSTAASHAQNTQIDVWRPPEPVKQAVIVHIARGFERALQGYADGRATPDLSAIVWTRSLDPDVLTRLAHYVAELPHG